MGRHLTVSEKWGYTAPLRWAARPAGQAPLSRHIPERVCRAGHPGHSCGHVHENVGFLRAAIGRLELGISMSATQKQKPALEISDEFLVSELQSNEGKAPKRGLWGAAIHRTTPPPGWGIPRGMTGVVLWTRPLHPHFRYSPPLFPGPLLFQGLTWGRYFKRLL